MTKPLLITLASAVLAIVPGVSNATPRAGDAAPAESTARAPTDAKTRYCIVETPTGSHIQKRICLTRDEWIKSHDFDPTQQ